jgi:hypothetical protein
METAEVTWITEQPQKVACVGITRARRAMLTAGRAGGLIWCTDIIIISSCYPLVDRASTKHRHLVPFLAILLNSLQLFPFSNASLWTDIRHLRLSRPLLLLPRGLQSKASRTMASLPFLCVSYPIPFPSFDLPGHLSFLCPSAKFFI